MLRTFRGASLIPLTVNGVSHELQAAPDTPLLWVLREQVGLTGTKFGCGMGLCGACTVLVEGAALRSCVMPVSAVAGQRITTIEGLPPHPVTEAWIAEQVPQCGYCQSGQILAAVSLLEAIPAPSDAEITENVTNLCRCGTYDRIRRAIRRAAASRAASNP